MKPVELGFADDGNVRGDEMQVGQLRSPPGSLQPWNDTLPLRFWPKLGRPHHIAAKSALRDTIVELGIIHSGRHEMAIVFAGTHSCSSRPSLETPPRQTRQDDCRRAIRHTERYPGILWRAATCLRSWFC